MNTKKTKKVEKKPKEKVEKEEEVKEVEVVPVDPVAVTVPENFKSKFTRAQIDLIKNTVAKGATDDELKLFLYTCQRTGLDPFTRQIFLIARWDSKLGKEVRMPLTGIDGLRSIAERTGKYAGNDDPKFDDEGNPQKATVSVYKIVEGQRVAFTATARWTQYYPGDKQGFMWKKMPHLMLGKCAEALALRKAFPAVMSGLYVAEEMAQAGVVVPGTTAPAQIEENFFEKAKSMIAGVKESGLKGLEEFKGKLAKSDKYTKEQKAELVKMIDARLKVATKEDLPTIEADAEGDL